MTRGHPRSTRSATLFPYATLFRSPERRLQGLPALRGDRHGARAVDAPDPEMLEGMCAQGGADAPGEVRAALAPVQARTAEHARRAPGRSEEHTSELQSLMRISYAVFCLKKKSIKKNYTKLQQ